jgi:hypothetical protein
MAQRIWRENISKKRLGRERKKKKIIDCHLTPPKTSEFLIFKQPEKMKRTTWNTEQGN